MIDLPTIVLSIMLLGQPNSGGNLVRPMFQTQDDCRAAIAAAVPKLTAASIDPTRLECRQEGDKWIVGAKAR